MDVSFTNVLKGARQYFQGLPAPSTTVTTGQTDNHVYNNQSGKTTATIPSDSRYDENKPNNTDGNINTINNTPTNTNQVNDTYWNTSGPNELRTMVEPYAPQPTRVEVPDTRPDDGRPECNGSPVTSLTEMQPPNRNIQSQRQEHHHHQQQQQQQKQQQQQQHSTANPSPQLHQMEPPKSHSPPVYQQLNNVTRSSYRASEVLNSHSTYQTVERAPAATPIVTQRAQYYPRYHHPDITKSAPAPFSSTSIYQAPQPNTSTTSTESITRTTPIEQDNSVTIPHRRNSQQEQQQQVSSVYTAPQTNYPPGNNAHHHQQISQHHHHLQQLSHHGNRPTALSNSHNQPQLLHYPNDVSGAHASVTATTTNPCSPRHGSHSHIPSSPHNHPGHIPSPHLPVASVPPPPPPPPSLSAAHALPQHQQQSQQNSHSNRINTSYPNRIIPYSSTHNSIMNPQQQMLPPPSQQSSSSSTTPSSSSNYQTGAVNNHESNHHATPSPHRQSPHVLVHNPHAISPHNPSPHHVPSPHNSTNFQPHSPTYPPPPPPASSSSSSSSSSRAQTHAYPPSTSHRSAQPNYPSAYPTSYHSYQKTPQSGIYSQTLRSQYGQQPQSSSSLNQQQSTSTASTSITNSDANGISYLSTNKSSAYNGTDLKRNSGNNIHTNQTTSYGSYRMPAIVQRNANTHNLPITAVTSYHSNRNLREAVGKAQTISRPRLSTINTGGNSVCASQSPITTSLSSRIPEYATHSSSVNSATTTTISYSVYNNNQHQQNYRNYSTTVAPSHSGHNSSTSTAVPSITVDTRTPTLSNATIHHVRTSSDQTNRSHSYSSSHLNDNNYHDYKEYSYANSSLSAAATAASSSSSSQPHHQITRISSSPPPPPLQPKSTIPVNGLPLRKRESPLDLSVKTVKTSADSTARDDLDNIAADKQVSSTSLSSAQINRSTVPSVNTPSSTPYVTYDSRGTNNGARNPVSASLRPLTPQMPVCAPKVDFLPNFTSTPLRHHAPSHQHNTTPENQLRRNSSQQMYVPPTQHQNSMPLPHMSTFKKNLLPNTTTLYDNKRSVLTSSYSSISDATGGSSGRGAPIRYPSSIDSQRGATIPVHDYPDTNKYYLESHNKHHTSIVSHDRMTNKRPGDGGFIPGASGPIKQPRMDNWKLVIDQEIQQKLEAARVLHEQQKRHELTLPRAMPNGTLAPPGTFNNLRIDNNNQCQTNNSSRHQAYCDKRIYPESKISRDTMATAAYSTHPIEKSANTPVGGGIQPLIQPTTTTASQAAYPTGYRQGQRSPYNCSGQTLPDQPSNTGADKRVLSLLRNSLENKQQREEQLNSQQPILVNHSQQSCQNKVVAPVEPKTNIGRHNLSPFTAASLLERNSNTPPHYKFHVPRAVDSITQESPRSLYGSRVNSSATLPAGKEALLGPREHENQIHRDKDDSLAAILAAKIRTKAELKQVGTGQFTSSKPVLLPSQEATSVNEFERVASTSTPQSIASSVGSPPKLTREKNASLPPRRRLFSRSEEENMPVAATIPAPAPIITTASAAVASRTSGFRSSSETSVFDFRESDSESEMPVLERQTLEEMRRDRKQLSKVQPPVSLDDAIYIGIASSNDLVKIELKENDNINEVDPFWTATCDKFMEQLRSGETVKRRGRKRKVDETSKHEDDDEKEKENNSRVLSPIATGAAVIKPEDIKQEIINDEIINPKSSGNTETIKSDLENSIKDSAVRVEIEEHQNDGCNNSGDDSDQPLIKRKTRRKKKKATDSDCEEEIIPKKNQIRRGSRIKLESSSASECSSDDDSDGSDELGHGSSVAHRLRARKRSSAGSADNEGMKLRSRDMGTPKTKDEKSTKTPTKNSSVQKSKPKPLFGDGSDFRPGWEEEVYVYKKSLRMPTRLISVSKPSRFHRLSTSLPDLDPGSPALSISMDSTDLCLSRKRNIDSDLESNYSFSITTGLGGKIDDEEATSSTTVSCPPKTSRQTRSESNSIVDLLARKVGGNGKKDSRKKSKEKLEKNGNNKILPKGSNEPELLATPSLNPLINNDEQKPKLKGKTPIKNNKSDKLTKSINITNSSYLLGYFRKETVNNFRDTFKNNHALPNEFSTFVLKSRTRTETRVLKKQATIREVFGEDRPASAPPMQNHAGDTSQDDDSQTETKESSILGRERTLKQKVVNRLRNVGILRSHKAIINSKRHLLSVQRRKVLLKSLTEKKLQRIKKEKSPVVKTTEVDDDVVVTTREDDEEDEEDDEDEVETHEPDPDHNDETEIPNKKKLKLRSGRRKFRSGFDYIRKKKKPLKKDESNVPRERKRPFINRPNSESVADLQTEIRTWVIKKGVGETILHRAARLGYTDVTAYCLEKLNSAPSPKDNAGYTPLHEACSRGHLEIAKLLLAYGANASESANGGIRPLHEAAENGAAELVRLLLSYGADPLLATYAGQTPLMLAVDTDAYSILEQHLGDVQGRSNIPWSFGGPASVLDCDKTGYNPLEDPPMESSKSELEEVEIEVSDVNLPVLFSLTNDPDKWVLLQDLMAASRVKSRDALLRQINPKAPSGPPSIAHRTVMREFKLPDFLEQSRCCHLLSAGERINEATLESSTLQTLPSTSISNKLPIGTENKTLAKVKRERTRKKIAH